MALTASGCTGIISPFVPVGIRIINDGDTEQTVRIVARTSDESTVFDVLIDVPPDDQLDGSEKPLISLPETFRAGREYRIELKVTDAEASSWDICPRRDKVDTTTTLNRWRFRIRPGGALLTDAPTC